MIRIRIDTLSLLLVAALCVLGWSRWHAGLRTPLDQDELLTIKKYASVDYDATADAMQQVPRFDVKRTVKGLARCFNNDWDPNNHIVNSLLISVSTCFLKFNETAYRMPALLAALALVALVFEWVRRQTGSKVAGVLCALVVLLHPYFLYYGEAARGYTWTALLVWVQLWLLDAYWRGRISVGWVTGLGLLSVVIFLNLASMLVTWIAPLYLAGALYLFWQREWGTRGLKPPAAAWLAQGVIAFVGSGLFILGTFRDFLASQQKYGTHFESGRVALNHLAEAFSSFFPLPWLVLGILGVWGWVRLVRGGNPRQWLGLAAFMALLVSASYVYVTRTVPYPRVFGFFLPLLILGVAECWRWAPGIAGRAVITLALGGMLMAEAFMGHRWPGTGKSYGGLAQEVTSEIKQSQANVQSVFIPPPWIYGEEMRYYLPAGEAWMEMTPDKKDLVTVYFTGVQRESGTEFRVQYARREQQELQYWRLPFPLGKAQIPSDGVVKHIPMRVARDFAALEPGKTPWIVVWNNRNPYFDLTRYVADKLREGAEPWTLLVNTISYLPTKSLHLFLRDEADLARVKAVIAELEAKSSGELYILTPVAENLQGLEQGPHDGLRIVRGGAVAAVQLDRRGVGAFQ